MLLISSIKDPGFARQQYSADKWPLTVVAGGKEYFPWDATIDVKPDVGFSFFGTTSIIGPGHGKDRVNQGAINCHQLAKFGEFLRQD